MTECYTGALIGLQCAEPPRREEAVLEQLDEAWLFSRGEWTEIAALLVVRSDHSMDFDAMRYWAAPAKLGGDSYSGFIRVYFPHEAADRPGAPYPSLISVD